MYMDMYTAQGSKDEPIPEPSRPAVGSFSRCNVPISGGIDLPEKIRTMGCDFSGSFATDFGGGDANIWLASPRRFKRARFRVTFNYAYFKQ